MPDFPHIDPTTTKAWKNLEAHFGSIQSADMNRWFENDPNRAEKFQLHWGPFFVDFSKNRIIKDTLKHLLDLAEETGLKEGIKQQFSGQLINETEGRAV